MRCLKTQLINNNFNRNRKMSSYPDDDAGFENLSKSVPQSNDHLKTLQNKFTNILLYLRAAKLCAELHH